jgi:hypothetical protein
VIAAYRFAGATGSIGNREGRGQGFRLSPRGTGYTLSVAESQIVEARVLDSRGREMQRIPLGRVEAGIPLDLALPAPVSSGSVRILAVRGERFEFSRLVAP